ARGRTPPVSGFARIRLRRATSSPGSFQPWRPAMRLVRPLAARQGERVRDGRELDLILLGATGFVGRLTAGYLAGHAPPSLRIGLAGRSEQRLAAVRDGLGAAAQTWPLLAVDSTDPGGARSLAGMAGAIATTVGPYRRLGLALAQACAEAGTGYADLTGEGLFIRGTLARCPPAAAPTRAPTLPNRRFRPFPPHIRVLPTP